jgi:hypothetical protein
MTTYLIQLSDGRAATIEADEVTTLADGSLWLMRSVAPKPSPPKTIAIIAARQWTSCTAADAHVLITGEPAPASTPAKQPSPRFA